MDSRIRQRLIAGTGLALAVLIGWQVAQGSFGLAAALAALGLAFIAHRFTRVGPDVLLTGLVLIGYLVGNRGFAQLHPPTLPLLPAETALACGLGFGLWRWAAAKRIPLQADAMNVAVALWIAASFARVPLDFRTHGFMAIRDFAMVYYALFFFLAQDWSAHGLERRYLLRCLTFGLAFTTPAFIAFLLWPEWLEAHLAVFGVPLIFVKSDVAGGFMAGGVFWFAERFRRADGNAGAATRLLWLGLVALSLVGVAISNSRAAAVALVCGFGWLALLRQWSTLRLIGVFVVLGGVGLGIQAIATRSPIETTPVYRAYEAAASVLDVSGSRTYRSASLGDKPDNNQFRMVWWRTVVADTVSDSPWFGLGFGSDLAADFLRVYYPDSDEDFTARSPHNFVLSVFARTGTVGLLLLLLTLVAAAVHTWRAANPVAVAQDDGELGGWLLAWSIFVSACFGVVLEGPMAAVVFWTALGLANARRPVELEPAAANPGIDQGEAVTA